MDRRIRYTTNALLYPSLQVDWPLRLLHIQTLTSYERSGIDTYNGISAPQYGILTYTWGRFQAAEGSPTLPVKGATWPIPPVRDDCFTVEAFCNVINHIGRDYDWVWIDVCCIDQGNADVKMSEIRRQVGIFHGAGTAFVWLHSLKTTELEEVLRPVAELSNGIIWPPPEDWTQYISAQIRPVHRSLRRLFADPWFTSLWTLQEATLRRDARLLSRDAHPVPLGSDAYTSLHQLVGWCETIFRRLFEELRENLLPEHCRADAQEIRRMIQKAGLNFSDARNPNVLYGAARHRQAHFSPDRIYGIMAIFQVGVAEAVGQAKGADQLTLENLEDDFARVLNRRTLIGGQSFVHLGPPSPGKSWRITQNSAVPEPLQELDGVRYVHSSSLTVEESGIAVLKGTYCPFHVLWRYWSMMKIRGTTWMNQQMRYRLMIAYDHDLENVLPGSATGEIICEETKIDECASLEGLSGFGVSRRLVESTSPKDLLVFRLGHRDLTLPSKSKIYYDQTTEKGGHLDEDCPQIGVIQDPNNGAPNEAIMQFPLASIHGSSGYSEEGRWELRWNKAIQERKQSFGLIVYRYPDGKHRRIGVCAWDDDNALPHELLDSSVQIH